MGAISVNVKSAKPIKASADLTGYVELDIDTGGAPKGEFLIAAGGIEKAVEIVSAEDMPIPTPSSSPIPSPFPSPIQHLHHRKQPSHFLYHALAPKRVGVSVSDSIMAIRKGFGDMNQRKGPGRKCHIPKSLYTSSTQQIMQAKYKMLTTITTTTTTTTTTVVAASQAAVFGVIGVVVLIALLIAKELLSASENEKAMLLGRITSVAINPLLFAFLCIVTVKVLEVL